MTSQQDRVKNVVSEIDRILKDGGTDEAKLMVLAIASNELQSMAEQISSIKSMLTTLTEHHNFSSAFGAEMKTSFIRFLDLMERL